MPKVKKITVVEQPKKKRGRPAKTAPQIQEQNIDELPTFIYTCSKGCRLETQVRMLDVYCRHKELCKLQ